MNISASKIALIELLLISFLFSFLIEDINIFFASFLLFDNLLLFNNNFSYVFCFYSYTIVFAIEILLFL